MSMFATGSLKAGLIGAGIIRAAEVPLDHEHVRPGLVALGLVLLLAVALFFLLRSFVKQLKKVDFDENPGREDDQSST